MEKDVDQDDTGLPCLELLFSCKNNRKPLLPLLLFQTQKGTISVPSTFKVSFLSRIKDRTHIPKVENQPCGPLDHRQQQQQRQRQRHHLQSKGV